MGKKLFNHFSSLLGFFLLGFSIWAIANELRQYHYREIFSSLAVLPASHLYRAMGLTGLSYLGLANYDPLAFRYIGHAIAYTKSVFTGFISAAATNTVGFAFLTGSARGVYYLLPLMIATGLLGLYEMRSRLKR